MDASDKASDKTPPLVVPVVEEHIRVDKQVQETGKVKVVKRVESEDVDVHESLMQEEVVIDRVPINTFVDEAPPPIRHEGEVTIVPVLKEVVVKRLLLVEELHIRKTQQITNDQKQFTLRTETVEVLRDK